ncbi:MAG TPA: metallophosphoesterase, partial [Candidatus Dormibacteraeota bacterium]|nr:metallophosphoesterase [Candidatus Dormibacteraeota bacterium]
MTGRRLLRRWWLGLVAGSTLLVAACGQPAGEPPPARPAALVLAVVGDYGACAGDQSPGACQHESEVAVQVHSWHPAAIVTVGDNSYENGTCDEVRQDSAPYASDIAAHRFYQVTGNHDWQSGQQGIDCATAYFGHPDHYVARFGNGLLDLFVVDANSNPDGCCPGSAQNRQYDQEVAASEATWRIEAQHQPRWVSACTHASSEWTDWVVNPRIDLYLAGHIHHMEHLVENGQHFVVNGAGGNGLDRSCTPIPGTVWSDGGHYGATRLTISSTSLLVEYVSVD